MTVPEIGRALDNALAVAAEGYPCFPCTTNKRPATPHGFRDAARDPTALRALWRRYPGALVGVVTGEASGIDVLDLDSKHQEARQWWTTHRNRLPVTRTHGTRSGGLHLLFQHVAGLRCSAGAIAAGVDTRASGGYFIHWPAVGLPVLCDAPLGLWPEWLLEELRPPRRAAPRAAWTRSLNTSRDRAGASYCSAALQHAAERVACAPAGSRNRTLNGEAYGIGRLVAGGLLDAQEAADRLAAAAVAAGLAPREIEATLRSALRARGLF
jgi:hypothetical protein